MDSSRSGLRVAFASAALVASALVGVGSASAAGPVESGGRPSLSVSHVEQAPSVVPARSAVRVQNSSVRVNGLRFRTRASYSGTVRGLLYRGDRVQVIGWSGPWMHVRLTHRSGGGSRAGTTGWVAKRYLYGPSCYSYKSWPCTAWR